MPRQGDYDEAEVRDRLERWFSRRFGSPATIAGFEVPGMSGYSSETMVLDVEVAGDRRHPLVVRSEPSGFRVFPDYDLRTQATCMEAVARHSEVPVPNVRWFEPDPEVLGRPFFVMDRVEGEVPPDNLPYTIHGFLFEAGESDQERLYRTSLDVLAQLHAIDVTRAGLDFLHRPELGDTGLEQQLAYYADFVPFATGGRPHPALDEGIVWLRDTRPTGLEEVLSWGDSRMGNIIYQDFEPAAVLDWEMAWLAPREQDVAWFLYFVRFNSELLGLPNLPGFPTEEEGVAHYEARTGHQLRHLDWFMAWAAFRFAVIMVRLLQRPEVRASTPDEWTIQRNAWTLGFARMAGLPEPEPGD